MCEMCGNWNDMGHQTTRGSRTIELCSRSKNTETDENGESFQIGMQCVCTGKKYRKEQWRTF